MQLQHRVNWPQYVAIMTGVSVLLCTPCPMHFAPGILPFCDVDYGYGILQESHAWLNK